METSQILNSVGLVLGMAGVVMLFFFGPPQPPLEPGISLGLEDATPIDENGKTVADYNKEVEKRRRKHLILSKIGLGLIFFGFALQLWATLSKS